VLLKQKKKSRKRERKSEDECCMKKQKRSPATYQNPRPVATNNFFAPLTDLHMENAERSSEGNSTKMPEIRESPGKGINIGGQIIWSQKRELELSSAGSSSGTLQPEPGSRLKVWWTTEPYKKCLTENKLHLFTFYTKKDTPVKAVIRFNISAEGITVALQEIGYDVINVKQMTAKRPISEQGVTPNLSSYLRKRDIKKLQKSST
jgi:hypothetical protein